MPNNDAKRPFYRRSLFWACIASVALLTLFLGLQAISSSLINLPVQWLLASLIPILLALIVGGYINKLKLLGVEYEGGQFPKTLEALKSTGHDLDKALGQTGRGDLSADTLPKSETSTGAGINERDTRRTFQLSMDDRYVTSISEKHPDLLVDECWRMVEAELERLSKLYNVQNTRDGRAFWGIYHSLESRIPTMPWIAKTGAQIRQLQIAARQAGPETTIDQARAYATEALRIARILSQFEDLVARDLNRR
jgi:hypothetical protein